MIVGWLWRLIRASLILGEVPETGQWSADHSLIRYPLGFQLATVHSLKAENQMIVSRIRTTLSSSCTVLVLLTGTTLGLEPQGRSEQAYDQLAGTTPGPVADPSVGHPA